MTHVQEIENLYRSDPLVTDYWYGKMIEEAAERDELDGYTMTTEEFDELLQDGTDSERRQDERRKLVTNLHPTLERRQSDRRSMHAVMWDQVNNDDEGER